MICKHNKNKKKPIFDVYQAAKVRLMVTPPQFLQPQSKFKLNNDYILSFDKISTIQENYTNFKKVTRKTFIKKKQRFDSFELDITDYNNEYTDHNLVVDRLESLNDKDAKKLAEAIKNSQFQFDYTDYYNYKETKEFQEFLQKIEIAKANRKGYPYAIAFAQYVPARKGFTIYKTNFSLKLIEILYNGDLNELYKDCINSEIDFPFSLQVINNTNYEEFVKDFSSFADNKNFQRIIELTRNGTDTKKATSNTTNFLFFNPKNPFEVLEMVFIQNYLCFEPQKDLKLDRKLKLDEDFPKNLIANIDIREDCPSDDKIFIKKYYS